MRKIQKFIFLIFFAKIRTFKHSKIPIVLIFCEDWKIQKIDVFDVLRKFENSKKRKNTRKFENSQNGKDTRKIENSKIRKFNKWKRHAKILKIQKIENS